MKLNPIEQYKAFPSEGADRLTTQMPLLIKDSRYPISAAELMQKRLEVSSSQDEELKQGWLYNYFFTGDARARRKDGRLKIILDSEESRKVNQNTDLVDGAIPQSDEIYLQQKGVELTPEEVDSYSAYGFSRQDALNNRIWRILARHPDEVPKEQAKDRNLLQEYINLVFSEGFEQAMGIYQGPKEDALKPWYVGRIDSWSGAGGGSRFVDDDGRLVGVRKISTGNQGIVSQEISQGAEQKPDTTLDVRILQALEQGHAFEFNGKVYVPSADNRVTIQ